MILCSMFLCSFCYFSYAENVQENIKGDGSTEAIIEPSIDKTSVNDLYKIRMFFCNDGIDDKKLTLQANMQARPGQEKNICFFVYNQLQEKTNITVSLYEWKKDGNGVSCADIPKNDIFVPMIRNSTGWIFPLSLSSQEQLVKNFKIQIPKESTGTIYWCVWFSIDGAATKWSWDIFTVIMRKAMPIKISITWDVYNFWRRDDIKGEYNENKASIVKFIIAILAVLLIMTIFKKDKKKEKHHNKK